ncbi:hypothetical protein V8F20_003546 [Naviculisporaceae sp. PSN 640]
MATWIDHPINLGNGDGELPTIYGIPIKPDLSANPTNDLNDEDEKQEDEDILYIIAVRLGEAPRVQYMILGITGLALVIYLAMFNIVTSTTSILPMSPDNSTTEDFQEEEGEDAGEQGLFERVNIKWAMLVYALVIFQCTVLVTHVAIRRAVNRRRRQQLPNWKEKAESEDKELLLKEGIYLD